METTQHINPDHFMNAVANDYADAWQPSDRDWVQVNITIESDHCGELEQYEGAVISFFMRHTVIADEPQCYEGYPEVEGTVVYEGRTYKFSLDTYTLDESWEEVK